MPSTWDFSTLGDVIAGYSGGPAIPLTAAGTRGEGREFEAAVKRAWILFAQEINKVATIHVARPQREGQHDCIKMQGRGGPWAIFFAYSSDMAKFAEGEITEDVPPDWLAKTFLVSDLVGPSPYSFAPPTPQDSPLYYGENYPKMFEGMTTSFDFSGALVDNGALREKMLWEYKYGKSTDGKRLDGNAHERLGYQVLQYLELAQRFPSCSFNVIASQSFSEFRSKYHAGFNAMGLRLSEMFQQVQFRFAACRSDYIALFDCFAQFLATGALPPLDYRSLRP